MNDQKHFVLLLLGGCLVAVAGESLEERQAPPPVADETVIFVAEHGSKLGEVLASRISTV